MRAASRTLALALLGVLLLAAGCRPSPPSAGPAAPTPAPTATAAPTAESAATPFGAPTAPLPTATAALPASPTAVAVLLAAGDIATCGTAGAEETAGLLDGLPGLVLALGDN